MYRLQLMSSNASITHFSFAIKHDDIACVRMQDSMV